jgi:phosphate transport system permease protein
MIEAERGRGGVTHGAAALPRAFFLTPRGSVWGDRIFQGVVYAAVGIFGLVMVGIAAALVVESMPAIRRFGFSFVIGQEWDPVQETFGALPFIYGTLVSSLVGMAIAVPLGIGSAIYLAELAPVGIRSPIGFLIELLAAVPSVVYGLWGIFVLAPFLRNWVEPFLGKSLGFLPLFQGPPFGVGMLAAGVVLAIMTVPFIATVSREVLLAVPNTQREAAQALGATRWETTWIAVLRYGRSGLVGAVLLGLGRALGETMAVTMVIGNRPEIALSLFAPGYTMASVLANEFTEATSDVYLSALVYIGLLLLVVTMTVNSLARLLVWTVGGSVKGLRE